jgi:hypothetical protein
MKIVRIVIGVLLACAAAVAATNLASPPDTTSLSSTERTTHFAAQIAVIAILLVASYVTITGKTGPDIRE